MPRSVRRLLVAVAVVVGLSFAVASAVAVPVVDFTGPATATVGEPVSYTAASGLCVEGVACSWSVDDADAGTGPTLQHTFTTAGPHTVTLSATDADGTATKGLPVTVAEPPPPDAPPTISFTSTASGLTASFVAESADPEGGPVTVRWDFGDGQTGAGPTITHTYSQAGSYIVTATASDEGGNTTETRAPLSVAVPPPLNQPPTISFTSTTSGLTASFAAATTDPEGGPVLVDWTFGDGAIGTGARPTHTYATGGTYTVSARVTDPAGNTATDTGTVTVIAPASPENKPPTVSFAYLTSGLGAAFAATVDDPEDDAVSVTWQFGDGTTSTAGLQARHTYESPGAYDVLVIARDSKGATGTATATVIVQSPQPGQPAPPPATPQPPASSTTPPAVAGATATGFSTTTPLAPASGTTAPPAAPGLRRLSPWPVVRIAGRFVGRHTVLTVVSVRAPRAARAIVRCSGVGCPFTRRSFRGAGSRSRRIHTLEGIRLRPGVVLDIRIVQTGRIGKRTRLRFAARQTPARTDSCVTPLGRVVRCPS